MRSLSNGFPNKEFVREYFSLIALLWLFCNKMSNRWRMVMVYNWMRGKMEWWYWLLAWPFVAMILAPFVGRFLKRRRERMERQWREDNEDYYQRGLLNDEGRKWRSPDDEEWRNRW